MLYEKELSYKIIGLAMEVHNELGSGLLEKVYENALMVLFSESGINAEQQKRFRVLFHGVNVGDYITDLIVDDKIILELKTVEHITSTHVAQTLNYLKITGKKLGIILNFKNDRLESKRIVI